MGHEPVLIPDISILLQLAIFLVCSWILNRLVFKPYLALLKLRAERTEGLQKKAAEDFDRASRLKSEIDEFLKAERKRTSMWADGESKKSLEAEADILAKARAEASARIAKSQAALENAAMAAQEELRMHAPTFASMLIEKLLGRKVSPGDIGAAMASKKKSTGSVEARS